MIETQRWFKDYQNLIDMAMQIARAIEHDIFYRNRETRWGCNNCEHEQKCLGFQLPTEEVAS